MPTCGVNPIYFCERNPPFARETAICAVRINLPTAEIIRTKDEYEIEKKVSFGN